MTARQVYLSRRSALGVAGAALMSLGAPGAQAAALWSPPAGLRLARIGIAAASTHDVADEDVSRLSGVSVGLRVPAFQDQRDRERFFHSCMSGHCVELTGVASGLVASRAAAAGVRLFRDHTINGERIVQLDPGVFGARFEVGGRSGSPEGREMGKAATLKMIIACADPERAAALAGVILGTRVGRCAAELADSRVTFVASTASPGLQEVHLGPCHSNRATEMTVGGVVWRHEA